MNKINVFTYNYVPWKYFSNWKHNIPQFFRNIKYAWQRATKGYCDQDLWSLDWYYANMFSASLKEMAESSYGYPCEFENEENGMEKWKAILNEMSLLFHNCLEDNEAYTNPYDDEYHRALRSCRIETKDEKGRDCICFEFDNMQEGLREAYFIEEHRIASQRNADKDAAFDLLKHWFFNLWD